MAHNIIYDRDEKKFPDKSTLSVSKTDPSVASNMCVESPKNYRVQRFSDNDYDHFQGKYVINLTLSAT